MEPVISTLNILKAQHAHKTAARQQVEEGTHSDTPPSPEHNTRGSSLPQSDDHPLSPAESENSPHAFPRVDQRSWDFSGGMDQILPPGLHRKSNAKNYTQAANSRQTLPIHFVNTNTRPSTPPLASTSASSHLRRVPSSEPPRGCPVQVSQQPHPQQTKSTQHRHSSPIHNPGCQSKKRST